MQNILDFFESFATRVPIELYVLLGAFIEDIIAPIPSPLVMTLAGSIAKAQGQALWSLVFLSILGAVGKIVGAWIYYFIADKSEDFVMNRFGKVLGISHKEIESIGKKLNKGRKDIVFLFLARAIPIIPSTPVSLACGLIKIDLRIFLLTTFAGTIVRNLPYLYLGYMGIDQYESLIGGINSAESVIQIIIVLVVIGLIVWAYYRRRKMFQNK